MHTRLGFRRIRPETMAVGKSTPQTSMDQDQPVRKMRHRRAKKRGGDHNSPTPAGTHGGGSPDSSGDDGRDEIASPTGAEWSEERWGRETLGRGSQTRNGRNSVDGEITLTVGHIKCWARVSSMG